MFSTLIPQFVGTLHKKEAKEINELLKKIRFFILPCNPIS